MAETDTSKRERPKSLSTVSHEIDTGWGVVYVNIGLDENDDPFEVFIITGRSGDVFNHMSEALGKTLSNALRSGADAEELADDLIGIRSAKVAMDNDDQIESVPDAVGVALRRTARGEYGSVKTDDEESGILP